MQQKLYKFKQERPEGTYLYYPLELEPDAGERSLSEENVQKDDGRVTN